MTDTREPDLPLRDLEPARDRFRHDVLEGLRRARKHLPCKYFYDEHGSRLFEQICELDAYYPTRTELTIMERHGAEMGRALGPNVLLVEYGSGSSAKTRVLLEHLDSPAAYVPVDISREHLVDSAKEMSQLFPDLEVLPVCADFTQPFDVPEPTRPASRTVAYFPGSTIGNLENDRAATLLRDIRALCGDDGGLLIGADLRKDPEILEKAYDDEEGVTAAFNLNLLERMNRELDADFDLSRFSHRAVWVESRSRIEMHLVSEVSQVAHVDGEPIAFEAGETICTEHSHKYDLSGFRALAEAGGFEVVRVWTDRDRLFSVQHLESR